MDPIDFFRRENNVFRMVEIEWWLLKYSDDYRYLKEHWRCKIFPDFEGGVCFCSPIEDDYIFRCLYERLEETSQQHRFEQYAKEQLALYEEISDDDEKIKEWLIRNEHLGSVVLCGFLIYNLDYSSNRDEIVHLSQFSAHLDDLIFVHYDDFENIVDFKFLFDDLYYTQEKYPEAIARMEAEWAEQRKKQGLGELKPYFDDSLE